MAPKVEIYQGGAPFAGDALGVVPSGMEGGVLTIEARNTGDALARGNRMRLPLERPSSLDPFTASGQAAHGAWTLMRRTGEGTGGQSVSESPWTPVGGSRYLPLPSLIPGGGVVIEVKLAVPGGISATAGELFPVVASDEYAVSLEPGHGEPGILPRYRDATFTYLIQGGELVAGAASIDVSEVVGVVAGVPLMARAETLTADSTAADGALAVGEGYWGTVTLDSTGLVLTKGNGAVLPLDVLDRVAGPGLLLGWASIAEDGTVVVYDGRERARFDLVDDGDLTPGIGRGTAIAGPGLALREDIQEDVTLPAAATDARIMLLPSGRLEVVTAGGTAAHPEAEALWQVTTDADSITASTDLRRWSGARVLSVPLGSAVDSVQVLDIPPGEWGMVEPLRLSLGDAGAGTGQTVLDLEAWDGAAWVSAFASDLARRPTIAAGDLTAEAWPETLVFRGGERWRVRLDEELTGGSATGISARIVLA